MEAAWAGAWRLLGDEGAWRCMEVAWRGPWVHGGWSVRCLEGCMGRCMDCAWEAPVGQPTNYSPTWYSSSTIVLNSCDSSCAKAAAAAASTAAAAATAAVDGPGAAAGAAGPAVAGGGAVAAAVAGPAAALAAAASDTCWGGGALRSWLLSRAWELWPCFCRAAMHHAQTAEDKGPRACTKSSWAAPQAEHSYNHAAPHRRAAKTGQPPWLVYRYPPS